MANKRSMAPARTAALWVVGPGAPAGAGVSLVNWNSKGQGGRHGGQPTQGNDENLFERANRPEIEKAAPLPVRMRPRDFDEFVGQEHIVGPGSSRAARRLSSCS